MKAFRFVSKLALLPVLAAFIALTATAHAGDATQSKDDLHKLVASAQTAADHQKLADYYNDQAKQAEANAAEHEVMLKAYAENPSTKKAMNTHSPEAYCRDMVRVYNREAQLYTDLALYHERMAKDAPEKKTPVGK